jgi:hypothetical protein
LKFLLLHLLLLALWCAPAAAQTPEGAAPATDAARLRIFLDCEFFCFEDEIRDEVDFVEYVRDRFASDVHVLVTDSETGSGGEESTVSFIGMGRYEGVNHTLRAVTIVGESEVSQRQSLANTIKIGLLQYLASSGVGSDFQVDVDLGSGQRSLGPVDDPWNHWVFSISGDGSLNGEESEREFSFNVEAGADRVTDNWNLSFGTEFQQEKERIEREDRPTINTSSHTREFRWLLVKSLGEHWSAGARGALESSTFNNTKWELSAAPALEYNFYPYSQYSRRQLRVLYSIGQHRVQYYEETLFAKTRETLGRQEVSLSLDQQEEWGEIEASFEVSNYLPGFGRYRMDFNSEFSINLAQGLEFDISGGASRIRDQLSVPSRGITDEERLLELRELQSGYEYDFSVGFTYTFGSIFSTIVNPRFGE